ncbi:hypothetical protein F5884DRAFT_862741 [Xylogone sp. PMI_703]|nr:hypothetical protein F5884DRAFT_862741 [Xylogone sp. PMI_703]
MTAQRQSNLNRAQWNQKCRVKLSEHIKHQLGIVIEPSQVRLRPSSDDVYTWERLGEKERLFSKNISDHSVAALKELYREVGSSFQAVHNERLHELPIGGFAGTYFGFPDATSNISFNSRINELECRLRLQEDDLHRWQCRADSEAEMRRQAEIRVNELERTIEVAQEDKKRLQKAMQECKAMAEQHAAKATTYSQVVIKIVDCLEGIEPGFNR